MIDTSSVFLHVLAAIGIVGGGAAQILSGRQLRQAVNAGEILMWARFTRSLGLLVAISAAVSLFTGGHLAGAVWSSETSSGFSQPFITLGVAALLLLVPVGPMVGGRRIKRLIEHATDASEPPSDLRSAARSPVLWGAVHSLVGVGLGLVALMVYKPGWLIGAALLLSSFMAGWASGVIASRSDAPAVAHSG